MMKMPGANPIAGKLKPNLRWMGWLLPSMSDVVFGAILALVLGYGIQPLLNSDGDTARHIAMGQQILTTRAIPLADPFPFTKAGAPFVPYEWLSEAMFALVHQFVGLAGVAVLSATLIALPFLLLTRWMVRDGVNAFLVLAIVAIGALASSIHWLARPHLFSILLALLWTRSLYHYESNGRARYLALLPLLMVLWVNLHGGFVTGFILLGVFFVGNLRNPRRAAALAGTGAVSLAVTGISPAHYGTLSFVVGYLRTDQLLSSIQEFRSPDFHNAAPQLFIGLVLLSMVSLALIPRRARPTDILLLLVWTYLGVYSVRNIPLFVVVCLPIVGRLSSEALNTLLTALPAVERSPLAGLGQRMTAADGRLGRPLVPILLVLAASLIVVGSRTEGNATPVTFDPAVFPVEALSMADELGVHGNLFNYYPWGGYIDYSGYPRYRAFIDGQDQDVRPDGLPLQYLKVYRVQPGWEAVLERYHIGWILIPHQSSLSQMLQRTPGWKLAYQDTTADILTRSP